MKRISCIFMSLFSIVSLAYGIGPITSFTPGNYFNQGAFLSGDGTNGSYKQFLAIKATGWTTATFMNDTLFVTDNDLTFDANGFFTITLTRFADSSSLGTYEGYGNCSVNNCGINECQLTVALSNGTLQEAFTIDYLNGDIYSSGAIYYSDGTPNIQWEAHGVLLE